MGRFFYAQFVVIWYGNIPEETAYVIERDHGRSLERDWPGRSSSAASWPFLIPLNRRIKTRPKAMTVICLAVMAGIWLDTTCSWAPPFTTTPNPSLWAGWKTAVGIGFLGLLAAAITGYFKQFPNCWRHDRSR